MNHLEAIKAGTVTKSNVIGLRKAMNANARRLARLSTSRTCPRLTDSELATIERAIAQHEPRVEGELHDSGLARLRDKRYAKRLEPVADIIAGLESFHLVAFDWIDDLHATPVYRARGNGRSFLFRNVAWQSGGDGPEIVRLPR